MTEGGICLGELLTSSSAHTKPLITHWIIISTAAHNVRSAEEAYNSEQTHFNVYINVDFVCVHDK